MPFDMEGSTRSVHLLYFDNIDTTVNIYYIDLASSLLVKTAYFSKFIPVDFSNSIYISILTSISISSDA